MFEKPFTNSYFSNKRQILVLFCYITTKFGITINMIISYWYLWKLTHSPFIVGTVGTISSIASFTGLFSGVIVDRFKKINLLLSSDFIRFLLILIIPLAYHFEILSWVVYSIIFFITTTISQFYSPAMRTYLLENIKENEISKINSSLFIIEQVSLVAGASIAGIVFIPLGIIPSYNILAFLFLFSSITLFLTKIRSLSSKKNSENNLKNNSNTLPFFEEFKETYKFIIKTPIILHTIPIVLVLFFSFTPYLILLSAWADEILKAGSTGYSLMETSYPLGMAIGGVIAGSLLKRGNYRKIIAIFLMTAGIVAVFFSFNRLLIFSLVLLLLLGMCIAVANIAFVNIQTKIVNEDIRGRFFATTQTFIGLVLPIGFSVNGYLANVIGIVPIFLGVGILFAFFSVVFLFIKSVKDFELAEKNTPKVEGQENVNSHAQ